MRKIFPISLYSFAIYFCNVAFIFLFLNAIFIKKVCANIDINCEESLKKAEQAYNDGRLADIKNILTEDCIKDFNQDDKIQAYYIQVLSSLYLNEKEDATKSMLFLLKSNPEYVCTPTTPIEFVKFYETFKVRPVYVLGFQVGGNISRIEGLKSYSLDNNNLNKGNFAGRFSYQVGLQLAIPIAKKLEFYTEINYKSVSYQFNNQLFDYITQKFIETQAIIEVPLMLKYNFFNNYNFQKDRKKFINRLSPYIMLGVTGSYLLSSNAIVTRTDVPQGEGSTPIALESPSTSMSAIRNPYNYYASAGFGVDYKKGRALISLGVRYNHSFLPTVNNEKRYNNQELLFKYAYIDNDIQWHNISFSVGYAYPFYKARPKKELKMK